MELAISQILAAGAGKVNVYATLDGRAVQFSAAIADADNLGTFLRAVSALYGQPVEVDVSSWRSAVVAAGRRLIGDRVLMVGEAIRLEVARD